MKEGGPLQHDFIELPDVRLHCVSTGSGRVALLLHGFPQHAYLWRRVMALLPPTLRAVAPDMRGYNLSSQPHEVAAYRMPRLVADVLELADFFDAPNFDLVGHDWGGVVAWRLAQTFPERVRRLAILNAPHPAIFRRELLRNPRQWLASSYVALFQTPLAERILARDDFALLRRRLLAPLKRKGALDDDDVTAYLEAWRRTDRLRGPLNYYRALRSPRAPGELRLAPLRAPVAVRTLVLWGERDRALLASNLDGLEEYVADVTVRRVAASHWIVDEEPGLVARELSAFLAP